MSTDTDSSEQNTNELYFANSEGYELIVDKDSQTAVRLHQVVQLTDNDPHKVFSNGEYETHHINGVPFDNRPDNLVLLPRHEHRRIHAAQSVEKSSV